MAANPFVYSRPVEPRRAARLVAQVAAALAAAHQRELVHRDVKPANVLISSAGGGEHASRLPQLTGTRRGL